MGGITQTMTEQSKAAESILAWHFVGDRLRNGRHVPADGEILRFNGPLYLCASGLHASELAIDAVRYAHGEVVCRVLCAGVGDFTMDKFVCSSRKILWRIDATETLRKFTRLCALDVAHLWEMPAIVRQYLETGEESISKAASSAAFDAANAPVAYYRAKAARAAAYTGDAYWGAARAAAVSLLTAASAIWANAGETAREAFWDAQNKRLTEMLVYAAHAAR